MLYPLAHARLVSPVPKGRQGKEGRSPDVSFPPLALLRVTAQVCGAHFHFETPEAPLDPSSTGTSVRWGPRTCPEREPIPEWGPDSPGVHQALDLSQMLASIMFFPLHSETKTWSLHSDAEVLWS